MAFVVTLSGLWGLWIVLAPGALAATPTVHLELLYELAFLGGLGGVASAMHVPAGGSDLLRIASPGERVASELVALLGVGLAFQLAALAAPALAGAIPPRECPALLGRGLLSLLHLSAIALLLLRLPMPPGLRSLAMVAASWLIPAAMPSTGWAGGWVRAWLDPSRYLEGISAGVETPPVAVADMAAVGALVLAAWLVLAPPLDPRCDTGS